jgi:hypothetical protein
MAEPAEALSAPDCNLLYGVRAIAAWTGMTMGTCRARITDKTIPVFRPPNVRVVCALKSTLNKTWAKHEAAADAHRNDQPG